MNQVMIQVFDCCNRTNQKSFRDSLRSAVVVADAGDVFGSFDVRHQSHEVRLRGVARLEAADGHHVPGDATKLEGNRWTDILKLLSFPDKSFKIFQKQ